MSNAIMSAAQLLKLPIDKRSVIRTVQELRQLDLAEFPKILGELYPGWSYANPLKTKYVVIYLIQEAMRKAVSGVDISMDRHLAECEAKADALLSDNPFIDYTQLPDFGEGQEDYAKTGKPKAAAKSVLQQVKDYCATVKNADRRELVRQVIEKFGIDKAKANTYVHIYLKSVGVIPSKPAQSKADKDSMLKKVKRFVATQNLNGERRAIIEAVMSKFNIDKPKAATYVSISIKEITQ